MHFDAGALNTAAGGYLLSSNVVGPFIASDSGQGSGAGGAGWSWGWVEQAVEPTDLSGTL